MTTLPLLALTLALPILAQQPPRITNGGLPSVSPATGQIAFTSNRDGTPDIYVINDDGSGLVRLTSSAESETAPRWSRDGRSVLLGPFSRDSAIISAIPAAGGAPRPVVRLAGREAEFSPDGRRALTLAGPMQSPRLVEHDLQTGVTRDLTDGSYLQFNHRYSPDGARIAYARRDSAGGLQVWVMDRDGGNARQLTRFTAEDGRPQWPDWSPDGRLLAVQSGRYDRANPQNNTAHIWIIDVETGSAIRLASHERPWLDETPSWFGDGRRIAFQSDRTGRMEVWVMNADGTGARQVTR